MKILILKTLLVSMISERHVLLWNWSYYLFIYLNVQLLMYLLFDHQIWTQVCLLSELYVDIVVRTSILAKILK